MRLRLYDIMESLQPYVKVICSMESEPGETLSPFRVLPDTCIELFINYVDAAPALISAQATTTDSRSFIVSRMNHFMDVQSPGKTGFIAVCFYPAAARHFFSLPMDALTNSVTGLHHIWGRLAAELEDRIATAANNEGRVAILQQCLINQLTKNYHADKAVDYCLWQLNLVRGQLPVGTLAEKTGISSRQLARRFHNEVGLPPKEFARITKFIHSLAVLKKYPALSLTEIAYESGYYDQAHFIHDYKAFSGYSPRQLLHSGNALY